MDSLTTISQMLSGNTIKVPDYQRAYSWDTSMDGKKPEYHVNTFLHDLQDHVGSNSKSSYYFGHFLFERISPTAYNIIDGQQRLTTISIFFVNLMERMRQFRELTEEEMFAYQSIVKLGATYHFNTVGYDDQFYKDYVINRTRKDTNGLDTMSQQRIANAYNYFTQELSKMGVEEVEKLIKVVSEASCSTHIINNEVEAIQMFIFQNDRGKEPSDLEVIKAQFMYNVHLYGGADAEKSNLLKEIRNHFESIYKDIASIECKIDEDEVLIYTIRVYFKDLGAWGAKGKVNAELEKDNRITFIREFTQALADSFRRLRVFFKKEKEDIVLHSVLNIADKGLFLPFVIMAYEYDISEENFKRMCKALESIFVRDKVIGTKAVLGSRILDSFNYFDGNVEPLIELIERMKTSNNWWGYWNNEEFKRSLNGYIRHDVAKKLLWRYENSLRAKGRAGYGMIRYEDIKDPNLEHIAPQTENPNNGYFEYGEDSWEYIECLGNYLLLTDSHNKSISNGPFDKKRDTYNQLRQHQEIKDMTEKDHLWDKEKILDRKQRIIDFLLSTY